MNKYDTSHLILGLLIVIIGFSVMAYQVGYQNGNNYTDKEVTIYTTTTKTETLTTYHDPMTCNDVKAKIEKLLQSSEHVYTKSWADYQNHLESIDKWLEYYEVRECEWDQSSVGDNP